MFCEFISNFIEDEYNFAFLIILKVLQITHHDIYIHLLNIEEIRKHNKFSTNHKHIELPLFMHYRGDGTQNKYINVFSFLWAQIFSYKDRYIDSEIVTQKSYPLVDNSLIDIRDKCLDKLQYASKQMGVQRFHQYIDKLILYINLDIPEIEKS